MEERLQPEIIRMRILGGEHQRANRHVVGKTGQALPEVIPGPSMVNFFRIQGSDAGDGGAEQIPGLRLDPQIESAVASEGACRAIVGQVRRHVEIQRPAGRESRRVNQQVGGVEIDIVR